MIGWLSKFVKPRIWQAMILAIIWLATKTCQPSHIWLAKSMAIFLSSFGLPKLRHGKFWLETNQPSVPQNLALKPDSEPTHCSAARLAIGPETTNLTRGPGRAVS
jgi:hypothetical protein